MVTTNVWEHNMRWLVRSLDSLVNGAEGGATSQVRNTLQKCDPTHCMGFHLFWFWGFVW